ncbi:MAG: Holliday junction branch migration protein RuvA [Bacilli bacterium]|jgi:Holliday junction DNA helicase RuvA|nr:Holliday junction branch migration protein RuvA [Bacilli bacterium]
MFYYLHGLVTVHTDDSIVVECQGVGYDCLVSHPEDFPVGENMFVFTCFYSHEDEQFLVGFKTLEEKALYLALTSVKGIGPKTALSALSATSTQRLKMAIEASDALFLMQLPGIGKKNASQIILDLKGKLTTDLLADHTSNPNAEKAREALKELGFKDKEIAAAFETITQPGLSVEDYTRLALRNLGR